LAEKLKIMNCLPRFVSGENSWRVSCAIEADFEKRKFILRVQDKVVELSKAVVEM